jgi:hypothetical protein
MLPSLPVHPPPKPADNILVPLPVLNYTNPHESDAVRVAQRNDSRRWLLAILISLLATSVNLIVVAIPFGYYCRSHIWHLDRDVRAPGPVIFAVTQTFATLALLYIFSCAAHERTNSWSFARGSLIGGLLPLGITLILLATVLWAPPRF